jgi:hypothetical protein
VASSLPWQHWVDDYAQFGNVSPRIQDDVGHVFDPKIPRFLVAWIHKHNIDTGWLQHAANLPEAIPFGLCPAMWSAARRHSKYTRRKCRGWPPRASLVCGKATGPTEGSQLTREIPILIQPRERTRVCGTMNIKPQYILHLATSTWRLYAHCFCHDGQCPGRISFKLDFLHFAASMGLFTVARLPLIYGADASDVTTIPSIVGHNSG